MIQAIKIKLNHYLKIDNERSAKILQNILLSFGVKGGTILVGLLLVPMTINYISPVQYGIWLTISSIVSWISFFDIGLGNGLRNKLTSALANGDKQEARKYVSTTYAVLTIIAIILLIISYCIIPLFDWNNFLNIPKDISINVSPVILVVVSTFCIQFVVQTINVILTATHEPSKAALILFLGQLSVLCAIYILRIFVVGSLESLVWVLTVIPIIILILASLYFFNFKLKYLAPNVKDVDLKSAGSILNIGGAFFIIQIGAMILFQTNNIIITKTIGPEAVTEFNIVYKLFSIIIMVFTIIITPYWSAFTDAYVKRDYKWMTKSVKELRIGWLVLSILVVPLFTIVAKYIYPLWIGNSVNILDSTSIIMGLYVIGYTCLSLNCFFLNGIGKLNVQLILYILSSIVNIPLALYLGRKFGVSGVIFSNILIFFCMNIVLWIQCDKILKHGLKLQIANSKE